MHYLLYVTYFINVTHAYASGWPLFKTYWLKFRFGITGVKRFFFHQNAVTSSIRLTLPVPLAKGAVSSSSLGSQYLDKSVTDDIFSTFSVIVDILIFVISFAHFLFLSLPLSCLVLCFLIWFPFPLSACRLFPS